MKFNFKSKPIYECMEIKDFLKIEESCFSAVKKTGGFNN